MVNAGGNPSNPNVWSDFMQGCYDFGDVSIGSAGTSYQSGNAQVDKTFSSLVASGTILTYPLVSAFTCNGCQVNIIGFMSLQVVNICGSGANECITFKVMSEVTGGPVGGSPGPGLTKARTLVQ
jgi:hypothetical protein